MRWYELLDKKLGDYPPDLTVLTEEPLANHTSFRIGGPARRMAFPQNAEQLVLLLNFAQECGAAPYILGNGTNVLFPDGGVDRLIINTRDMAQIEPYQGGGRSVSCACGEFCLPAGPCGAGICPWDPRQRRRRGLHECRGIRR